MDSDTSVITTYNGVIRLSADYYGSIAGQKHWFVGVVKDVSDPNNRVRLQIKGIHPEDAGGSSTPGDSSAGTTGGGGTGGGSSGSSSAPTTPAATGGSSPTQGQVSVSRDDLPSSTQFSAPLSPHFTLGSLVNPKYRNRSAQLTPSIIYNLKNLAVNCLEPLKARYPGMIITSGWRPYGAVGTARNHPGGYAVDFQVRGQTPASIVNWIQQNLRGRYTKLELATRHVHIQLGGGGTTANPIFFTGTSS